MPGLPRFWEGVVRKLWTGRREDGGGGEFFLSSCMTPKEGHLKAGWCGMVFWGSVSNSGGLSWSVVGGAGDSLYALLCCAHSYLCLPPELTLPVQPKPTTEWVPSICAQTRVPSGWSNSSLGSEKYFLVAVGSNHHAKKQLFFPPSKGG